VAESRELAKRDNVIVPETNEDYTRSGISTEQQQQSNPTDVNVQGNEAQEDDIAYPEDEWANYDDDNEGNLYENIAYPEGNVWIRIRSIGGEEDGRLMTAVEDDAETANSNTEDALYQVGSADTLYTVLNRDEEDDNADTVFENLSDEEESTGDTEDTFYAVSVPDTDDEDDLQPEEGRPTIANRQASISSVYLHDMPRPEPTIATQASASISSVYLHDMPRPEPTIATQASASISSVYLHDVPRTVPTIATQASASISSVYLHDMPRPEPTIANRQLSNESVYL
jgi:hypothetical protein